MEQNTKFIDYYEVLNVWPTADPDAIKKAYFKLAKLHHPDVAGESTGKGGVDFKLINEAFAVLSDPVQRREFDEKLKRKTGDWATAAAAVVLRLDGGRVSHVRIALTNLAPTALRATDAEAALQGRVLDDQALADAAARAMAACDPAEDLRGDREYKTAMAGQMVKRALATAAARCR